MKKDRPVVFLFCLALIMLIIGIFFLNKNVDLSKNKIEILDATYNCQEGLEKFFEDSNYVYYFTCAKSKSVYVKFSDGTKMLVTKALNEDKVTIEQLLKAGLDVYKKSK